MHQLTDPLDRRCIAVGVVAHQPTPRSSAATSARRRVVDAKGFHQNVLARLDRGHGDLKAGRRRGGHQDRLYVRIVKQLPHVIDGIDAVERAHERAGARDIRVAHRA